MSRKTRTTSIEVKVPTTFKAVADTYGIPSSVVARRYHAFRDENPRKVPSIQDLVQYQNRSKYSTLGDT